jgi:hypothetical protein
MLIRDDAINVGTWKQEAHSQFIFVVSPSEFAMKSILQDKVA